MIKIWTQILLAAVLTTQLAMAREGESSFSSSETVDVGVYVTLDSKATDPAQATWELESLNSNVISGSRNPALPTIGDDAIGSMTAPSDAKVKIRFKLLSQSIGFCDGKFKKKYQLGFGSSGGKIDGLAIFQDTAGKKGTKLTDPSGPPDDNIFSGQSKNRGEDTVDVIDRVKPGSIFSAYHYSLTVYCTARNEPDIGPFTLDPRIINGGGTLCKDENHVLVCK